MANRINCIVTQPVVWRVRYGLGWGRCLTLERDIIAERVRGGLRKAKANGKRLGRPESVIDTDKIVEHRKQNKSIRQIASEMNLSRGTVERTLKMCL